MENFFKKNINKTEETELNTEIKNIPKILSIFIASITAVMATNLSISPAIANQLNGSEDVPKPESVVYKPGQFLTKQGLVNFKRNNSDLNVDIVGYGVIDPSSEKRVQNIVEFTKVLSQLNPGNINNKLVEVYTAQKPDSHSASILNVVSYTVNNIQTFTNLNRVRINKNGDLSTVIDPEHPTGRSVANFSVLLTNDRGEKVVFNRDYHDNISISDITDYIKKGYKVFKYSESGVDKYIAIGSEWTSSATTNYNNEIRLPKNTSNRSQGL